MMKVEIIFKSSSTPKCIDARAVYTKGGLLCIDTTGGPILKYPLVNVFQVAHEHGPHMGSTRREPTTP